MKKQIIADLVVQAQNGDRSAIQNILEECYEDLYFFAYKTVQNQDLACDIVQESCIEIMTHLDNLRTPAAFSAWARKITYHQCTRHFRQCREVPVVEDEDGETVFDRLPDETPDSLPEQVYENKEFQQIMQNFLDTLPPEQRSALMLYYYERMSVKEIAAVQDTTEGTVKSRLNYGRKAVKSKVEDYEKKNGVRLHSLAPLPLLLLFLFGSAKNEVSAAGAYTAVQGALASGTAGATGTADTAASVIAQNAGKGAAKVMGKVIAGVLAAGVTVGGVFTGVTLSKNSSTPEPESSVTQEASPNIHTHSYSMEYDKNQHWNLCACGDTTAAQMHRYESGICSLCSYEPPTSDGLTYSIHDDYCTVTGMGTCEDTTLVIPAQYEDKPVRYIGRQAFEGTNLVEVILPDTVEGIDFRAFSCCLELRRIHLGKGMKEIGLYAFCDSDALEEIEFSEGLQRILSHAFDGCSSLVDVALPDSVTEIQNNAFRNCINLQTLKLNSRLIEYQAFADCTSLQEVTFGEGITQIEDQVFSGCINLRIAELPNSLTTMGDHVFENCTGLIRASIPGSVLVVPNGTFNNCTALANVVLGEGIHTMEASAFENCRSLQRLTLPDSLIIMGNYLFVDCISLKEMVIPSGVEIIPFSCFEGCTSLEQVTLPSGLTGIDIHAFGSCTNLRTIRYNGSVSEWYAIDRGSVSPSLQWHSASANFVVVCTDGNIAIEDA